MNAQFSSVVNLVERLCVCAACKK